jgi:exodeoxyribonuclease VII large subunit
LIQSLRLARQRLDQSWRLAQTLHPDKPLERGYVLVTDRNGGVVINTMQAARARLLTLRFRDGAVPVWVEPDARPAYDRPKPEQPSLL